MSTYAQVSDVRGLAPSVPINASTNPSEGQVQIWLDLIDTELDAILGNLGYVTPVASDKPKSRVMLKDLAATGALAKVLRARAFGVDSGLIDQATAAEKIYRDQLKALKSAGDPYALPDAQLTDEAVVKSPSEQAGSHADETYSDFDLEKPRVTRAQAW